MPIPQTTIEWIERVPDLRDRPKFNMPWTMDTCNQDLWWRMDTVGQIYLFSKRNGLRRL